MDPTTKHRRQLGQRPAWPRRERAWPASDSTIVPRASPPSQTPPSTAQQFAPRALHHADECLEFIGKFISIKYHRGLAAAPEEGDAAVDEVRGIDGLATTDIPLFKKFIPSTRTPLAV